jgi:hypothetical protein
MTVDQASIYCANHPTVETVLRCNRCEKPICVKCAILTPTGYRCKECVRGQQKVYETAQWFDYLSTSIICLVLAFLGSLFIPRMLILAIILSPIAGTGIAEAARLATQKRRSTRLFKLSAAAVAAGCLPLLLYQTLFTIIQVNASGLGGFYALLPLISHVIYLVLITTSTYYRFSGFVLKLR